MISRWCNHLWVHVRCVFPLQYLRPFNFFGITLHPFHRKANCYQMNTLRRLSQRWTCFVGYPPFSGGVVSAGHASAYCLLICTRNRTCKVLASWSWNIPACTEVDIEGYLPSGALWWDAIRSQLVAETWEETFTQIFYLFIAHICLPLGLPSCVRSFLPPLVHGHERPDIEPYPVIWSQPCPKTSKTGVFPVGAPLCRMLKDFERIKGICRQSWVNMVAPS